MTTCLKQNASRSLNICFVGSKLLLTYLPNSYRVWMSTLIDLGALRKRLYWHQNYPPPPGMHMLEFV